MDYPPEIKKEAVDNLYSVVFSMGAEMLRMEVFGDEGLKFPGETVIFPETDFLRIQDMLSTMSIPAVWTGKCIILSLSIHKGLFTLSENNAKFDLCGLSGNSIC